MQNSDILLSKFTAKNPCSRQTMGTMLQRYQFREEDYRGEKKKKKKKKLGISIEGK